jgi:hypothetical protein
MRMSPADVVRTVETAPRLWLADVIELPPYHYGAIFVKHGFALGDRFTCTDLTERIEGEQCPSLVRTAGTTNQ